TAGRSFGPVDFRPTVDALGPYLNVIREAPFRMQWINDARAEDGWWQAGRALVGTLVAAAHRLGVELRTDARVTSLNTADGAVVGLSGEDSSGDPFAVAADAVILASGGFEHSPRLLEQHFGFTFDAPMSPPWNEGDGLIMAQDVGADVSNLNGAWWTPVFHVGGEAQDHSRAFRNTNHVRALPGTILVNARGQRFVDEARSYSVVGRAMAEFDPAAANYPNRKAWLIFGGEFMPRYGVAAFGDLEMDASWSLTADSLETLGLRAGIDPNGLVRTVADWNLDMARGRDSAFHRGENYYDRYQGDQDLIDSPSASLAAIADGPYTAVRVFLGALGTKGGPRVDSHGRVLGPRQGPIPGLYAAGNVASSVMRAAYAGGGATIGPALTFGYLAGEHAAARHISSLAVAAAPTA
ncbi:MAG: FAD-dependent oxidoreductase, partial [Microbacterium sp.]